MNEIQTVSRRSGPVFTEKSFYLEEFYGKSLLFALVPPSGERLSELDSLNRTLSELRRNQSRCIVIASTRALPRLIQRLGRRAPRHAPLRFNPAGGLRSRPYPPDSAVSALWQALRANSIVAAEAETDDPGKLVIFAQQLASRLRVFKLLLLDRAGGLVDGTGNRDSFIQVGRVRGILKDVHSAHRRGLVRAAYHAISAGVASVSLVSPREVYEELFSYSGTGTIFTEGGYGHVRQISIEDFEEVEALIIRAQNEGFLLSRSEGEIARLLPSCFGYRIGDEHLAGVVSLLTEPYHREHAGEITALYTLTRFQGEGVAAELMNAVIKEARARRLRYVFACTTQQRAAHLFEHLGFRQVEAHAVPSAKWRGYDKKRIALLSIYHCDLSG
ncbi:MAG: GNAT family N-acetyltransferase [Deltaproteobacteria bacterium]|nr:GNAT family N-acetyltransferase [Deltaproteobacteria bacterium]MBV8454402.1 GNAT family N-acetyltransferase [Deltaproteobacteria bacterium]